MKENGELKRQAKELCVWYLLTDWTRDCLALYSLMLISRSPVKATLALTELFTAVFLRGRYVSSWFPVLNALEYKSIREVSEDWFDATERLTGVDFTGTQENGIEHDEWNPKSSLGWFRTAGRS